MWKNGEKLSITYLCHTGSVIVIISALVVWLTEWKYSIYIDPALSLCLVTLITVSTWPLLKVSALILLQTVPTHIQVRLGPCFEFEEEFYLYCAWKKMSLVLMPNS